MMVNGCYWWWWRRRARWWSHQYINLVSLAVPSNHVFLLKKANRLISSVMNGIISIPALTKHPSMFPTRSSLKSLLVSNPTGPLFTKWKSAPSLNPTKSRSNDMFLKLSGDSHTWQTYWQHYFWVVCHEAKRYDNLITNFMALMILDISRIYV